MRNPDARIELMLSAFEADRLLRLLEKQSHYEQAAAVDVEDDPDRLKEHSGYLKNLLVWRGISTRLFLHLETLKRSQARRSEF